MKIPSIILTAIFSSLLVGQTLAGTPAHNGPYAPWNKAVAIDVTFDSSGIRLQSEEEEDDNCEEVFK